MQISERLRAVAGMVSPGCRLADVGTDHAYIPIYLMQNGVIPQAVAMDINQGPLLRATENIRRYGLTGRIETRLSDGLEKLQTGEADTILIAGMGGLLMVRILENGQGVLAGCRELVLQPQSDIRSVRAYLEEKGWQLDREDLVFEDGKYYPMMSVTKKETAMPLDNPYRNAKDIDFLYGAYLLKEGHPVLQDYLKREAQIYRELLEKLSAISDRPEIQKRIHEVEKKAEQTERAIQEMSKRANQ